MAKITNNVGSSKDKILDEIKKASTELKKRAKAAKQKYDELDDADKKKVLAGFAAVAGIIAGIISSRKINKKKDK